MIEMRLFDLLVGRELFLGSLMNLTNHYAQYCSETKMKGYRIRTAYPSKNNT